MIFFAESVWTPALIAAIFAGLVSLIGAVFAGLAVLSSKANTAKIEETAKVVDVIHTATNGAMSAQMKTLAEVTAAKAVITKNPTDEAAAKKAMAEYLDHIGKLSKTAPAS